MKSRNKVKKNHLKPLKTYICSLIDNIDKTTFPKSIDLILDGGAFNGGYQYGMLFYLRELEFLNLTHIDRISGCSIGAILAVVYFAKKLDHSIKIYEDILKSFRKTCHFNELSKVITDFVNEHVDNVKNMDNKLFITYHDMLTMKQVVVSKYKSKEDLIQTLIKSTHIPFLIDGSPLYKNRYSDGYTPYIFPKSIKRILFISLINYNSLKTTLYIKNEVNIWTRLLTGIVDINNFFMNSNSNTCSYIDTWGSYQFCQIYFREIFIIFMGLIFRGFKCLESMLPNDIYNNVYIIRLNEIGSMLYKDLLTYYIL
jgi:hypothetical protein